LEESATYIDKLQAAFDSHSCDELKACSHAIKGASGSLGATTIYEMAGYIEQSAINNNYDQGYTHWDDFKRSFDDLKKALLNELKQDEPVSVVVEEGMKVMLINVRKAVVRGGFLTPGELVALKERAVNSEVEAVIEMLGGFTVNFETEKAVDAINKIAAMENISLS
jgi:HPt (histidine-containing phosphotransfer) domain-containing protein